MVLGELVDRCRSAGVQVMDTSPGDSPKEDNKRGTFLYFRYAPYGCCRGLGSHSGIYRRCGYITPAEHLGLPTVEHVREGVIAFKIAAHVADIAKGIKGAWEWDLAMSRARYALDWETQLKLALDLYEQRASKTVACSMCWPFCPMNLVEKFVQDAKKAREEVTLP